MRCTVIGGAGFIGYKLSLKLLRQGHEVVAFDCPESPAINSLEEKGVLVSRGDYFNLRDLQTAINGSDVVFHLISTTVPKTSNNDPINDIQSNVIGTLNLLNIAKENKVKKIIFPSSGGTVYGDSSHIPISEDSPTNPVSSYGISKLAIEKYLGLYWKLFGLDYQILRISNAYGPGQKVNINQGVIPLIISKALASQEIVIWGSGSAVRDYVYIDDIITGFIDVMNYQGEEKIFNIGSGIGYSINEIIDFVQKQLGRPVKYHNDNRLDIGVQKNILDITLAKRELNWIPKTDIVNGIRKTIEFLKSENYDSSKGIA